MDFADALNLALSQGEEAFVTFCQKSQQRSFSPTCQAGLTNLNACLTSVSLK